MRESSIAVIAIASLMSAGCTRISARSALIEVTKLVGERTSTAPVPVDGTAAKRELDSALAALPGEELSADTAVRVALLNNRSLRATYQRLGIAQADLVQAGLLPNPIVHAGLRLPIDAAGPSAEVSVAQDFISAIEIPMRKRVSGAAFEAAKLEVAAAAIDLVAGVKRAFYTLQGAYQMLELRRSIARASDAAAEVATRQHRAGNITDLELASEQALLAEARLELARAEAEVAADREELNVLLGLWGPHTGWNIAARLPDVPSAEIVLAGLERLAVTQRLDLAAARQATEVQARALGLTRFRALLPSGDIAADAEREPEGAWTLGPAIEVPLLIFDQGQAAVARASAEFTQTAERYAALAVEVRAQVRRAHTQAESARARAVFYRDVALPLRRRVVAQTQLEYNAMLVGVLQLLQAKRDEIEGGRSYIDTVREYWVARAELERAVGGDLRSTPPPGAPSNVPAALRTTAPTHQHDDHHHEE